MSHSVFVTSSLCFALLASRFTATVDPTHRHAVFSPLITLYVSINDAVPQDDTRRSRLGTELHEWFVGKT